MKILFLTNLLPYPLDNGGKIKTYTTLSSIKDEDTSIDLLCFSEDKESDENHAVEIKSLCSNVYIVPSRLTTALNQRYMLGVALKSLFSKYSFGTYKYFSKEMNETIIELNKLNEYDCIYFDHLQMCVYYNLINKLWPNAQYILDEHNCEYLIMERNAINTSNLLKKAFLTLESVKLKKFESCNISKFNKTVVLSQEDEAQLKSISKGNINTCIIPIGMKSPTQNICYNFKDIEKINILFVGTLSWAPNNDGIIWFVKNVIPLLDKAGISYSLTIVGKNPGAELSSLVANKQNVHITGYVESVYPYYEKADCMIVPLFVGSGQRVKIIEGFSLGMPMISTTIGAEGLTYDDNVNILIANTSDMFVEKLKMMKLGNIRERLSNNAKATFEKMYSVEAVKERIREVLYNDK